MTNCCIVKNSGKNGLQHDIDGNAKCKFQNYSGDGSLQDSADFKFILFHDELFKK